MRERKRTARVVAMALSVAVFGAAYVAFLPANEAVIVGPPKVCTYYKDASKRKVIGQRGTGCCGETISWGSTSTYFQCQTVYCLDVVCPDDTI